MLTGSLLMNEIMIWLKRHRRNGCGYEKENRFLFCKTPSGAQATATVFSLIETAKANRLNPFKYLVYIFEKLSQDEDYDLEQLMPWTESVAGACKAAACE